MLRLRVAFFTWAAPASPESPSERATAHPLLSTPRAGSAQPPCLVPTARSPVTPSASGRDQQLARPPAPCRSALAAPLRPNRLPLAFAACRASRVRVEITRRVNGIARQEAGF